jgi:hypothetical protein
MMYIVEPRREGYQPPRRRGHESVSGAIEEARWARSANAVAEEPHMRKQTTQYTSPLDALITVAKRLSLYENQQHMDSESFFDQYSRGQLSDDILFVEWANDYRHYLELRRDVEQRLHNVA